ncbi:MAG: PE-PGRS family protein, partial [Bacteroidota bacterium]
MKIHSTTSPLFLFAWLLLPGMACGQSNPIPPSTVSLSTNFSEPVNQGEVQYSAISEASGIVASRNNPDILWTHNDSGNAPKIYAISTSGEIMGEWVIGGATNRDWEDIAIGPGPEDGVTYLYVGDIGDNQAVHASLNIYRFPEPLINSNNSVDTIRNVEKINLKYPDGARDAETLLVDPFTRDLLILSKRDRFARLYRLPYPQSTSATIFAEKLGEWPREITGIFNQPVGGDLSLDGRELLIKSYVQVLYWQRESSETSLFELMQQEP